jgi:transaldolase
MSPEPAISAKINKMIKIKNRTRAISAEVFATPVKPKTPATIAIIKNIAAHCRNIVSFRKLNLRFVILYLKRYSALQEFRKESMKLFLDTAEVARIQQWAATGLVDGVTTNPTHLSKEGGEPKGVIQKICALLPEGDISVEITEKEPQAVYEQAKKISHLAENIVVKIPCFPSYVPIIEKLVKEEIGINITLVFSALQGLMMAKLGVLYISPFIGRLDDIDHEGIQVIAALRQMLDFYGYESEILAASIRTVLHVEQAVLAGADAVTVPIEILEKLLVHPLTESGMKKFDADWKKLGIAQFP